MGHFLSNPIKFFGLYLVIFGLISILFEFIYINKLEDKFVGLFIVSVIITVLGTFFVYQKEQIYNWIDSIFPQYYGIFFYALCLIIIFLIPIIVFTILKCSICILIGFSIEFFIVCIINILMKATENMNTNNLNQNEDREYIAFETINEENKFIIVEKEKGELEQQQEEKEEQ